MHTNKEILIRQDDLAGAEVQVLLRAHLQFAARYSPPESVHALDLAALRAPDITFWTAWDSDNLMGCGALKELDPSHGEVKSMRTDDRFRRRGVAAAILHQIIGAARSRSYRRLSLETGSPDAFAPARALYSRFGFVPCAPFADYTLDPYSFYMTLSLDG